MERLSDMYITKINLDKTKPEVRRALADRQQLHRMIQKMFGTSRKDSDVLFRLAGNSLYVSSEKVPNAEAEDGFTLCLERELPPAQEGSVHRFSLVAQPRKVVNAKKIIIKSEEERLAWLKRKASENGFEICSIREEGREPIVSRMKGFDVDAYNYSGVIRITDEEAFERVQRNGIGPMKAYGCGFLMIV